MKTATLLRVCSRAGIGRRVSVSLFAALLFSTVNVFAAATVNWLSGGPFASDGSPNAYGHQSGDITADMKFHTPCGLAIDLTGNFLIVADRDNDAVRVLEFDLNSGGDFGTVTNVNGVPVSVTNSYFFSKPVGVAVNNNGYLFVLNYAKGTNGYVLQFTGDGEVVATNLTRLTNAAAITLDVTGNIYVTASNQVFRVTPFGVSNVVATVPYTNASLQGIVLKRSGPNAGKLAVCDAGRNGIYLIDPNTGVITTNSGFHGVGDYLNAQNTANFNASAFFQPSGIAESGDGTLIVTDFGNHRVKAVRADGSVTNLYGVTSNDWVYFNTPPWQYPGFVDGSVSVPDQLGGVAARQPNGVVMGPDGTIFVTEDYYHIIRTIVKGSTALKPPLPPPPPAPTGLLATADYGQVFLSWQASAGATNYNIKRSTTSGTEVTIATTGGAPANPAYTDTNLLDGTTYFYVVSAVNSGGEGQSSSEVSAMPLFSPAPASLIVTATNFGSISLAWSPSAGATRYHLKRSTSSGTEVTIATISSPTTSYNDTTVVNGETYYYVVTAINPGGENPTNSPEVSVMAPVPPPPPPRIGWYDYEGSVQNGFFSVLHPVTAGNPFAAHNPLLIAIDPSTNGVSTKYITIPPYTNNTPLATVTNFGSTPPAYQDGALLGSGLANPLPSLALSNGLVTIEAANIDALGQASAVASATFKFQVGTPDIQGNNAALFTVSDITTNVVFFYTLDGTDPTNAPPSQQVVSSNSVITLSLNGSSNILFQARAFGLGALAGYLVSDIALHPFSTNSFVPNTISFGTPNREPSSHFLARPGQFYYAPVTLNLLPNFGAIYSLDFNVTVTNGLVNTNTGVRPPPIVNGAGIDFFSMLMSKVKPDEGRYFPPADGNWYLPILPITFNPVATNSVVVITVFTNTATTNNLLGVGYFYRTGFKYKATDTNGVVFLDFDTAAQDLTAFSIAHDTLFKEGNGTVIVGAYSFQIPITATNGDKYFIQLGSPSATSDGVGAPGSSVFIQSPANNQAVIVSSPPYLVGDAAPFHWLNAGDFGDTNLDSSDVQQVYQSAILGVNMPPANSDLFAAMDSSGSSGFWDGANNYYTNSFDNSYTNAAAIQALFDGNDQTINTNIFGDGNLDISDLYVTFRRSEDNSLLWFQRYWTNGQFVAVTTTNLAFNTNIPSAFTKQSTGKVQSALSGQTNTYQQSSVLFMAGDVQVAAGQQSVQIPITADVFGSYRLRVLGLNVTVHPLDGSPDLTQPVQFTPSAGLGQPSPLSGTKGNDTYAAAWLDSTITGLTGNATIGYLTVTLPANATSMSAYAVHFDRASGSPNGLVTFPKQTWTGLITLSSRTNSSFNDGIPDSWRLRWFGTIYNLLSVSNACPSGDGVNNWKKYIAGVDPNTANDFPSLNSKAPVLTGATAAIHWPSVYGKQYVILRSPSLFSGSWTAISTNTGTGTDMEFDDNSTGQTKFYRVLILP